MQSSPHPGGAAVMPRCLADQDLADGRIELRRETISVSDGASPLRLRGPPNRSRAEPRASEMGPVAGRRARADRAWTAIGLCDRAGTRASAGAASA
jgi:hypothetical protein